MHWIFRQFFWTIKERCKKGISLEQQTTEWRKSSKDIRPGTNTHSSNTSGNSFRESRTRQSCRRDQMQLGVTGSQRKMERVIAENTEYGSSISPRLMDPLAKKKQKKTMIFIRRQVIKASPQWRCFHTFSYQTLVSFVEQIFSTMLFDLMRRGAAKIKAKCWLLYTGMHRGIDCRDEIRQCAQV